MQRVWRTSPNEIQIIHFFNLAHCREWFYELLELCPLPICSIYSRLSESDRCTALAENIILAFYSHPSNSDMILT